MLIPCSQHPDHHDELIALETLIRENVRLIYDRNVQRLLRIAHGTFDERAYGLALDQLKIICKIITTHEKRTPDHFRPHCPESLSRTGQLHLLDQIDGLPISIDPHKLVTGLGIFGPQGSGKSCAIMDFCAKIRRIDPAIRITILDPKGGFSNLADFDHVDLSTVSIDFSPPSVCSDDLFVYELMPPLAGSIGLIYALALLQEAVDIAFAQRRQYDAQTGLQTALCLKDIDDALKTIKVTGFRKTGYHDAASTALSLILGRHNLFSCRSGVSLAYLFSRSLVLNARNLTDETQCRFLALYLLYWLYQQARFSPETNRIKHILIIDDASRFIGVPGNQFDGTSRTSPIGHYLAVLRTAGVFLGYATQLPAHVDPSILSLTRNGLVIGNINGKENLDVIQSMMSLTDEQRSAIPRFKPRETLAFISGLDWPYPIHGWTADFNSANFTTDNPSIPSIEIMPWHSLVRTEPSTPSSADDSVDTAVNASEPALSNNLGKLVYECVVNPFDNVSSHIKRLGFSVRIYEAAKNEATQNGFLIASTCGKSTYLIPTDKAFSGFNAECPYKRATSIEHSFYVLLVAHYLKMLPGVKVQMETPIGSKGATIDITTTTQNGEMYAYEITLNTSNLPSLACRLQGTAFSKIVWLCRDEKTAKAVAAFFNKSMMLPTELTARFEYISLQKWLKTITSKGY